MLGALHARRLYEDQKASFLGILPLRSISRAWGSLMSMKIPVWMRPYAYKAWARAFHSNLEGRLFPVNERATRTIRNLYVENERVVLEGIWKEGFMALAAVGATNIGSIELFIEPELRTNKPKKKLFPTEPPEERVYDPEGHGLMIEKGKEVGVFNMGSTVVLVIQAPTAKSPDGSRSSSDYQFCVKKGDRVHVGQALGKKNEYKVLCTNNIQHSCFWLGFAYYAPT